MSRPQQAYNVHDPTQPPALWHDRSMDHRVNQQVGIADQTNRNPQDLPLSRPAPKARQITVIEWRAIQASVQFHRQARLVIKTRFEVRAVLRGGANPAFCNAAAAASVFSGRMSRSMSWLWRTTGSACMVSPIVTPLPTTNSTPLR